MSDILLQVCDLKRHFPIKRRSPFAEHRYVRAVDGVSFNLERGKTLSIVGESGCGKSTLARMVLGLDRPTAGAIKFNETDLTTMDRAEFRKFRLSVQAVFQDPTSALDPKRRVRQILAEPFIVNLSLSKEEINERIFELLDQVGLNHSVAESFPHELSGGMRQRVAVAHAIALKPDVIVLDEPVSALDVSIRAQIMNLLRDLQDRLGLSYVMISHDLGTVRYLSHEVAAMYVGEVVEHAPRDAFFDAPLHPYTVALISAVGSVKRRPENRIILEGETASPAKAKEGCRFAPRCWLRKSIGGSGVCSSQAPDLKEYLPGHLVACHHAALLIDPQSRKRLIATARPSAQEVPC